MRAMHYEDHFLLLSVIKELTETKNRMSESSNDDMDSFASYLQSLIDQMTKFSDRVKVVW